jgi:uncharacterized protein YndB with AHSA1/START domain
MAERTVANTTFSLPSEREIVMTHVFDAPARLVFEAWTTPEHVRRWFLREETTLDLCEIDLRVGGAWHYTWHEPDGAEHGFHGEYQEITPPHRLVYTEFYDPFPDAGAQVTLILEERDGRTTMTCSSVYPTAEIAKMVLQSGMEDGAAESMNRLAALLETLR